MRVLRKFCYVTNIFDLHIFDKETVTLLNFFEISTKMLFVSLFVLIERNITTSLLMIHLKCSVVYYSSQNSSSISRLFLNYRLLNMLVLFFFRFLVYVYLNEIFVKKIMKYLSFFDANFQNLFWDVHLFFINNPFLTLARKLFKRF